MLPGVGVFGTSLTARVIIPLLKNEGFSVKALWGRTQEEAEELARDMNVPFYTNRIDDVLLHPDVDLVCINLPPPLTRQIAVKTLEVDVIESCSIVFVCLPVNCRFYGVSDVSLAVVHRHKQTLAHLGELEGASKNRAAP
ncbi:glucose-fructose oxidoreductase domain-containing 1 [Labeo rohita]|uniref:Glucose-fructose oxidoreductase domain-containing 1 n=1 Tax=Labeo rohita TaxID=84645 RepID=A0A498M209_LABRO|nr:glucose-fructose oxidoreductase domain-containing 1 [Labeo rohita]RXN13883.1 glucose-fructose oxidoreductase domain-containing 1 [Labeo rohita]